MCGFNEGVLQLVAEHIVGLDGVVDAVGEAGRDGDLDVILGDAEIVAGRDDPDAHIYFAYLLGAGVDEVEPRVDEPTELAEFLHDAS